jgi:hypothetical protein
MFHEASIDPVAHRARTAQLKGYVAFLKMVDPADRAIAGYEAVIASIISSETIS